MEWGFQHRKSVQNAQKLESYIKTGVKLIVVGECCARIEQIAGINVKQSEALVAVSPQSKNYNHCLFRLPRDGKHYTEENGICQGLLLDKFHKGRIGIL